LFGGDVDYGETPEEALSRELCEEIDLKDISMELAFRWKDENTGTLLHYYYVPLEVLVTSLSLNEGQDMGLFSCSEINSMSVTPDIRIHSKKIQNLIELKT